MDELAALDLVGELISHSGDDCAIVDELLISTDMLHEQTDFPPGTTFYTKGWRAVGASLSDIAAMGGSPVATVAIYGAPTFEKNSLEAFLKGCVDVCEFVGTEYVGGDLDGHKEITVATTAVGRSVNPVLRSGAAPGDALCVTGEFGQSAAAVRLFSSDVEKANELFQFEPRIAAGKALAPFASSMMDSSDGLARSCHQLSDASQCGFSVRYDSIPVVPMVSSIATDTTDEQELSLYFGEDFELVCTIPENKVAAAQEACPVPLTRIGTTTSDVGSITLDNEPFPNRGYAH